MGRSNQFSKLITRINKTDVATNKKCMICVVICTRGDLGEGSKGAFDSFRNLYIAKLCIYVAATEISESYVQPCNL